jgi:hypothetical protein
MEKAYSFLTILKMAPLRIRKLGDAFRHQRRLASRM